MKTSDFNYNLPQEFIAQSPAEPRHSSRLLVLRRDQPELEHTTFWNIANHLRKGDLLVINQTRVIPARIYGKKDTGGKAELLLLRRIDEVTWETIVGGKRVLVGRRILFENGPTATVVEDLDGPKRLVRFDQPIERFLEQRGQMPLPPYIHEELKDPERYQTVYSKIPGSAAAPTAGLHFTPELMTHLNMLGVEFANVTLHVGLDTFAPVNEEDPEEHHIHTEWCEVTPQAADKINRFHAAGGRIIAVGTTSVRTLETAAGFAGPHQVVGPFAEATDLFILPGYDFQVVNAMITNFHLPRSTLLMLVSAFAGREKVLSAYQEAMESGYRFYSFGDAMLIV